MFFIKDQFATVWKVEDKGTFSTVQMSTSRKDRKTEGYINSSWSFVRFVGKAYEKSLNLERQSRITIKLGGISRESYDKDGEKLWPKNPSIVVFDFEESVPNTSDSKKNKNIQEDSNEEEPGEMPF